MENQTVFIKRYPSNGEFPKEYQHVIVGWNQEPFSTRIANRSGNGYWFLSDDACDCDEPDYWLEEIELPSEEEIYLESGKKSKRTFHRFIEGANFIINHLKSNTNEKDKI